MGDLEIVVTGFAAAATIGGAAVAAREDSQSSSTGAVKHKLRGWALCVVGTSTIQVVKS